MFQTSGLSAGIVKWSYAFQDPDHDPGEAEQDHDREEHAREADGEVEVAARVAEELDDERRSEHEDRRQPRREEEDEPEDRRCDPPRPRALTLLEELAENGDEGAGKRRIRDERADEVRDLERDRERVDPPGSAERIRGDHLTEEP